MSCPGPLQCRAAAVRIDAPPNTRQFRKQSEKKNVPELDLVAIFCEKKSETVAKHGANQSNITLFRLAIPKMAVFGKKSGNFSVFVFGVWGLSGLRILLSYFWPAPLLRPKEKSPQFFFPT